MNALAQQLITECKRTKSTFLDIGRCGLAEIPSEVFELEWLEELNLGSIYPNKEGKQVRSQNNGGTNRCAPPPAQIARLQHLKGLYLSDNQIQDIRFLEKLTSLHTLDLRYNQIQDIRFLEKLTSLHTLDLSSNQIQDIRFLEKLTSLHTLDLSSNKIQDIRFLEKLTSLHTLYLRYNKIQDYSFLEKLTSLHTLDLRSNQIQDIRFLEKLTSLHTLDLSYNKIQDIRFLEKMPLTAFSKRIDISKNQIKDLRPFLPWIKKGMPVKWDYWEDGICVEDNPFTSPPPEIIKQGNEAIIRYFEELDRKGKDYLYEAKVLLVGEGNVGKTTLREKLEDPDAGMPPVYARTPGIDIVRLPFEYRGKPFHLNIWDFGGQNIYYHTHHFFLTRRSLYVLLTGTRSQDDNFDYWIPNICLFGGDSPILVVKNKWQDAHKGSSIDRKISISRFRQNEVFKLPENIIEVNLYTNEGLPILKEKILHHATHLPLVGSEVPKSWVEVRTILKQRAESAAYISYTDFEAICKDKGIVAENTGEIDKAKVKDLAQFFHDLGIVLWYHELSTLKEKVILQPEWATRAVYQIINDEQIQKSKGHFGLKDVARIWTHDDHCTMQSQLLELMTAFRLCYKKRNRNRYIIPALLSPDSPFAPPDEGKVKANKVIAKWDYTGNLCLQYHYSFMPKGIVNQVTAELHDYIAKDRDVWGRGVLLTDALFKAKIEEDWFERTIDIRVSGLDARAILRRIADTIEKDIHQYYPGIDFEKYVPCICERCQEEDTPKFYTYEELLEVLAENEHQFYCNRGRQFFNIHKALFNIGIDKAETAQSLRDKPFELKAQRKKAIALSSKPKASPKKLFISYSKADSDYLAAFKKQLKVLDRKGELMTWDDGDLLPSEEWDNVIKAALAEADIIVLLVSSDFLATDYIHDIELATALKRRELGDAAIVPIIIRPCFWEVSAFAQYNVLPKKGEAIDDWENTDKAWLAVVKELYKVVKA